VRSAQNTIEMGPEAALTGPVQRGEHETVHAHARALDACPPYVGDLYRASAAALVEISRRRGLSDAAATAIHAALKAEGARR
jgi:predicted short-subunit dehydrogenase-like oxidoreductase (DUF2520 family)